MSSSSFIISLLALCMALFGSAAALRCLENDRYGKTIENNSAQFEYCALIPGAVDGRVGRQYGVSNVTEDLGPINGMFAQNTRLFKIKATCILEQYRFFEVNAAFGAVPEHLFRCFCKGDFCNRESTFAGFIASNRN